MGNLFWLKKFLNGVKSSFPFKDSFPSRKKNHQISYEIVFFFYGLLGFSREKGIGKQAHKVFNKKPLFPLFFSNFLYIFHR